MPRNHPQPAAELTPLDFAASNATSNAFLGGKQKSWMTGAYQPPAVLRSQPGQANTHPPQPPPETHIPPTPSTEPAQVVHYHHHQTPSAFDSHNSLSPVASESNRAHNVYPPSTSTSPHLANVAQDTSGNNMNGSLRAPVLPSPAPSDEGRGDPNGPGTNHTANRIPTPVVKNFPHHNVKRTVSESLDNGNKRRRGHESPYQNQNNGVYHPSASSTPDVTRFQGAPENSTYQSPGISPGQPFIPRTISSNTVQTTPASVPPPYIYQQDRPSSMQNTTNANNPDKWFNPEHLGARLDTYIRQRGGFTNLPPIEQTRMRLVKSASSEQDFGFLFLHQLLYLWDNSRTSLPAAFLSLQPSHLDKGMAIFRNLLALIPSHDRNASAFYTNFPCAWKEMQRMELQVISTHVSQLALTFETFHQQWGQFLDFLRAKNRPPVVRDIYQSFGINSSILQIIIFEGVVRQIWSVPNSQSYVHLVALFTKDQKKRFSLSNDPYIQAAIVERIQQALLQCLGQAPAMDPGTPISPTQAFLGSAVQQTWPAPAYNAQPPPRVVPSNDPVPLPHTPQPQIPGFPAPAHNLQPVVQNSPLQRNSLPSSNAMQLPNCQATHPSAVNLNFMQFSHHQRTRSSKLPLIPPPNARIQQPAQPNHERSAIHQLHLQSPIIKARDDWAPGPIVYRHVTGFALYPVMAVSRAIQSWWFQVPEDTDIPGVTGERYDKARFVSDKSKCFRLRCVKWEKSENPASSESDWVMSDTSWAPSTYWIVNGKDLEPRRKLHNGKDLPIDITEWLRKGDNVIEMQQLRLPTDVKPCKYAVAVEVVSFATYDQIKHSCSSNAYLCKEDSVMQIKKSLAPSDDDDLCIVNNHMTIDMLDPWSGGSILNQPVRGKSCPHRSCFDLETLLSTRRRRKEDLATAADDWRCPICRGDVRPQNLITDGFLVEVANMLREQGSPNVRSILVEEDGSWRPKPEKQPEQKQAPKGSEPSTASVTPIATARSSVTFTPVPRMASLAVHDVIDLDDD